MRALEPVHGAQRPPPSRAAATDVQTMQAPVQALRSRSPMADEEKECARGISGGWRWGAARARGFCGRRSRCHARRAARCWRLGRERRGHGRAPMRAARRGVRKPSTGPRDQSSLRGRTHARPSPKLCRELNGLPRRHGRASTSAGGTLARAQPYAVRGRRPALAPRTGRRPPRSCAGRRRPCPRGLARGRGRTAPTER